MKIVILNNDFRAYWKNRLIYLRQYLNDREINFYAIELFGKGSPYSFDAYNNTEHWWSCLFPHKSSHEISNNSIKQVLFSALDTINPDVIIAPSIVFYPGALGLRWAKKNSKKFIMFDDAKAGQVKRMFIVRWIKDLLTKQADGFWLPSPDYYSGYAHLRNSGLHFFYGFNSIDNTQFKASVENPMNQNLIICVARLVPVKNIDALINAWCIVEEHQTGYRLLLVGNGPDYERLNTLKTTLKLKTVGFLGAIANESLPEYYHKADAFTLPSFSESWGLVVNEAMAAGLPVLLSGTINAGQYLLKEGVNGFAFNPLSVQDIAGAILKFINLNVYSKKLMSKKSLETIDSLSFEKMGIQLSEALKTICTQKIKKPGLLASAIINAWNGRYNTAGWDN